jgi:hypothetical protein
MNDSKVSTDCDILSTLEWLPGWRKRWLSPQKEALIMNTFKYYNINTETNTWTKGLLILIMKQSHRD